MRIKRIKKCCWCITAVFVLAACSHGDLPGKKWSLKESTFYDSSNVLPKMKVYENQIALDTCVGQVFGWYDNGQLKLKYSTMNGLKHGELVYFHRNGEFLEKSFYVEDTLHGKSFVYYSSGQNRIIRTYDQGLLIKKSVFYSENGEIDSVVVH